MLEASKPVAAKAAEPRGTGKGEVTLVAPSASGKAAKASGKVNEALQNEVAILEEGLDKAARENKELSSRLTEIDKQIKSSDKLLAVKNDQISGLQEELTRLRKEQGIAAEAAPAAAEPAAAEPAAEVAAKPAKPAKAEEPAEQPVAAEEVAEPASSGSMLAPIVGVLALLGIGGGAFWFLRRRKAAAGAAAPAATAAHDEQVEEDLAQLQDLGFGGDEESSAAVAAPEGEGGGDPLGEADMYVAYGRFQQAADILYAALQREPDRDDIRVKLAEVYAEMGDNDAAGEHANALLDSNNSAVRHQAQSILARIGGGGSAAAAAPAKEELSLDDLAQEFSGGGGESPAAAKSDDFSLDFDLPMTVSAPKAAPAAPAPAVAEDSDALEFSLDDVDLGEDVAAAPAPSSSTTEVRPKADFGELSLEDDSNFGDLTLEDTAPAAAPAEEFTLEDELTLEEPAALPSLDEEELDFAATTGAQQKLTDELVEEVTAAPAPAPSAADIDLESELADLESDLKGEDLGGGSAGGDDFDFLADSDENATKLDLAKAYIDMGDAEGARDILNEVASEGNATQKGEAQKLLAQLG